MDLFLQHNAFSSLHNERSGSCLFYFSKHELLNWADIAGLGRVILISGNTDESITSVSLPDNVVHWFVGNSLVQHPKVTCIPLGLENAVPCSREDHGVVWPRAGPRITTLQGLQTTTATHFCLANFTVDTNPTIRKPLADICKSLSYVKYYESLSMTEFLTMIPEYEAVVCPEGNGPDTHRVWEVLYAGRIPIVFRADLYETLYKQFPVVVCSLDDLQNEERLRAKVTAAKSKDFDRSLLFMDAWKTRIRSMAYSYGLRHNTGPYAEYATHQPVLLHAVRQTLETNGPILELGCGESSTELLHLISEKYNRRVISVESNASFYETFRRKFSSPLHTFVFASTWDETLRDLARSTYDVVFIDHGSFESRAVAFRLFKASTFLVLHDCDYLPEHGLLGSCSERFVDQHNRGSRDYSNEIQHWHEYFPVTFAYKTGPPTLLASPSRECTTSIDFTSNIVFL